MKNIRIIIIMLFVFSTHIVNCQSSFIYGRQFGSDKDGVAYNPVADKYGNVYIAGDTKGELGGQYFGKMDGFVSKFDSLGNTIWTKQIGTGEDDQISWIATDRIGNVYVTGYTNGLLGEKRFGKEDVLVAKFDTNGNLAWQKQFGSDSTDVGDMVYVDFLGNIYIVGATKGTFGNMSFGGADGFILKLDSNAHMVWINQLGTKKGDECSGITGDSTNIYVCGYTFGNLGANNAGSLDAFVAKFTDKGEQIKLFQFGSKELDIASQILVDKEKNIYLGGSTKGELGCKPLGEGDCFLSKISQDFKIIWTQQFGTNKWDGVNGIALNEEISENIIVSGCQKWPSCQSFIRIYKKEGSLLWVNNYIAGGKNGGTCGKGVCIDNKGSIYHSGNTGGNLFRNIDKKEGHDVFLIKLSMDKG